jgi:hypothetical protein
MKSEECLLLIQATKRKMELRKEDSKLERSVEAEEAKATVNELDVVRRSEGSEYSSISSSDGKGQGLCPAHGTCGND